VAAVPLAGVRPDAEFLAAFDRYSRGGSLTDARNILEAVLAAADWTGYAAAQARLEALRLASDAEWATKARAWREAYGIEEPSGA